MLFQNQRPSQEDNGRLFSSVTYWARDVSDFHFFKLMLFFFEYTHTFYHHTFDDYLFIHCVSLVLITMMCRNQTSTSVKAAAARRLFPLRHVEQRRALPWIISCSSSSFECMPIFLTPIFIFLFSLFYSSFVYIHSLIQNTLDLHTSGLEILLAGEMMSLTHTHR